MLPGLTQMGGALFRCITNPADTINYVGPDEVRPHEVVVMHWKILK